MLKLQGLTVGYAGRHPRLTFHINAKRTLSQCPAKASSSGGDVPTCLGYSTRVVKAARYVHDMIGQNTTILCEVVVYYRELDGLTLVHC